MSLADAQRLNLIGQGVAHWDPSGLATVERIDLSGQPAHLTRRLIRVDTAAHDGEPALDWSLANRDPLLEDAATATEWPFTAETLAVALPKAYSELAAKGIEPKRQLPILRL